MAEAVPSATTPDQPKTLKCHYIKGQAFRTIHVDGVIGGPRPRGDGLCFAVFSERVPLPQVTEQTISPEGRLGELVPAGTVMREGLVRELEAFLSMDLDTAKRFHVWLTAKLQEMEKAQRE